jgi:very-short-patch-repair endonuclease
MTEPEWRLWKALRGRTLAGLKFVRQHPIAPFIVDFCCREAMVVVEIDGWTHGSEAEFKRDQARDNILASLGYRVMRFHNAEVMTNLEGVLETIRRSIVPEE